MKTQAATALAAQSDEWTAQRIEALFETPFFDLLYHAQQVHRAHFPSDRVQLSTLMSIKTGGCSEDCGYCSQSAHHETAVEAQKLVDVEAVIAAARAAKEAGATRFCMGAAWRGPKQRDLESVKRMVREVKSLGLETCVTLGELDEDQADQLKDAGLDYYNHNLDTAPDYYEKIVSTHDQQSRFDTLQAVREAGIKVCSGGIVGMGETRHHRAALLAELAALDPAPESVPINQLIPIPGTPLADAPPLDPFEFVRTIACARIVMPASFVRLSAGRQEMSDELQALCFLAGANSIFYGEHLLTTGNPDTSRDQGLFERLGLKPL